MNRLTSTLKKYNACLETETFMIKHISKRLNNIFNQNPLWLGFNGKKKNNNTCLQRVIMDAFKGLLKWCFSNIHALKNHLGMC